MTEDKTKANRLGGPYMIQDRDHLSHTGQFGGQTAESGRQSQQTQSSNRQQGAEQSGDGRPAYRRNRQFI